MDQYDGAYDFFAAAPASPVATAPSATVTTTFAQPPPRSAAAATESKAESRLRLPVALGVTVAALALSGLLHLLSPTLINPADVIDESLRRALVLTIAFYLLVGMLLLLFLSRVHVRLVWQRTGVPAALLLGVPLGLAGGLLAVGVNSAVAGHLASDPNVEALVGGGGLLRIALTFVVVACLAPLIEETIFRGICAGTFLAKGTAPAICISAVAFAVWHLNAVALRYYAVLGLVLAGIWLKRGLIASISAHAAFNGVLTVAAIAATTGVGASTTFGTIAVELPGGWHTETADTSAQRMVFAGPAGAALALDSQPDAGSNATVAGIESRLAASPALAGGGVDPASVHVVSTPLGTAVAADLVLDGQPGDVLEFDYRNTGYELVMITAGSPAAAQAWQQIERTLHPAR